MSNQQIQILSPARDKYVAHAAIQAGADAVYIGAPAFGAREKAGNSIEDIAEVVREAHTYGVQVLVTVNTLLHDDEYPQAVEMIGSLYRIGVDAIIVQDLHLLDFNLPPIRLHASTHCDNRTPEQVARLRDMGFKRVVLARELGIAEIRAIREAVPDIELEAFVHGALCVSYSGQCYMSEVLAGRSANRGACAQFCRMAYDLLDANGREIMDDQGRPIHQRYLLSLQDMDRSAYLQEMIDAGITTFKIEGRLKDADYVTNITAYYRMKLDQLLNEGAVYKRTFTPDPAKTFHRGGIDYFLHGRTPHMANFATPKSTGEYIGKVLEARGNTLRVSLNLGVVLHNGDGLSMGNEGFNVNGVNGNWIKINKTLPPNPHSLPLREGSGVGPLYRNLDTEFVKSLHSERRIPVDIVLSETAEGFRLQIGDRTQTFAYTKEPAKNADKALENIRTQLSKLGDTPYIARYVRVECPPYFIPISVLNDWRRSTLEEVRPHSTSGLTAEGGPTAPAVLQQRGLTATRSASHLMTCKYCLLHELGHCRKVNPYPQVSEPRYLRLRTGTTVALSFDCRNCQMLIDQC